MYGTLEANSCDVLRAEQTKEEDNTRGQKDQQTPDGGRNLGKELGKSVLDAKKKKNEARCPPRPRNTAPYPSGIMIKA